MALCFCECLNYIKKESTLYCYRCPTGTSVSPSLFLSCPAQPNQGTLPVTHGSWKSSPLHSQSHSSTAKSNETNTGKHFSLYLMHAGVYRPAKKTYFYTFALAKDLNSLTALGRHLVGCWQALWTYWFSFYSRTWHLYTLPRRIKSWFSDPGVNCVWLASRLTWSEPQRESIECCQEKCERQQWTMQMSCLGFP